MPFGIERLADHVERLHAAPSEHVDELAMDELDASAQRGARGVDRRRECALEIVDHRQQVANHIHAGHLGALAPLALRALPVVVELGCDPEQPLVVVVALTAQGLVGRRGIHGIRWDVVVLHETLSLFVLIDFRARG